MCISAPSRPQATEGIGPVALTGDARVDGTKIAVPKMGIAAVRYRQSSIA